MKSNVTLSLSPIPPFVGINIDIPAENIVTGRLRTALRLPDASVLVGAVITMLLEDQYAAGDACGAWSKQYPAYLTHIYGGDLPADIAVRDTITYSSWIASALHQLANSDQHNHLVRVMAPRIAAFIDYLSKHSDDVTGGFGLRTRPTSRGVSKISPDLRHTAWAMLSLAQFGRQDLLTAERLRRAGSYVHSRFSTLEDAGERSITYAVLHLLLSSSSTGPLVVPFHPARRILLRRLETKIVEGYDSNYGSWDMNLDPPERAAVDNALFVLYCMPLASCVDQDAREVLKHCYARLRQQAMASGLPLDFGAPPNVGATAMLAYLLARDTEQLPIRGCDIDALL